MRAVRTSLLILLVLVGLVGMALPASAHFTQFEVAGMTWDFGNDTTRVFVRFTCTAGERYRIRTDVDIKPNYNGIGRAVGTCTGTEQVIEVESQKQSGQLRFGRARVIARGFTFVAGAQHGDMVKDVEFF